MSNSVDTTRFEKPLPIDRSGAQPELIPLRNDKQREDRARRALARQGFRLCKSRRRNCSAIDYGGYLICDLYTNGVVAGGSYFCLTLDDVEMWARET